MINEKYIYSTISGGKKMSLKDEETNMLCYFVFIGIAVKNCEKDTFPKNLKFVFSLEDINLLEKLIKSKVKNNVFEFDPPHGYYIYNNDIEETVSILKNNLDEYLNDKDENIHYIYIDDISRFNTLLNRLHDSLSEEFEEYKHSILNDIWIRMSPNDLDDIYKFLDKQILFIESKFFTVPNILSNEYNKESYICDIGDYKVMYNICDSGVWCETNRKVSITMKNKYFKNRVLFLPDIYFETIVEDGRNVCYIYAIQNHKHVSKCFDKKSAKEDLLVVKKQLKNKSINYKFILTLEFFIQILKENGIYDIKVPLLQLFNYDYHISMSEEFKKRMVYFEEKVRKGKIPPDDTIYEQIKEVYDNVVDKEDIISKNKTEKLVETFMLVEEKFQDIEILSEPFIEDENLLVKVLDISKDKSLKRILK